MSIATLKGKVVEAKLWAPVEEIESSALDQLKNIASLPWAVHVAVMPDVHFGKGATVGSVIGMRGAISPAAVGVDIGCGMGAIRTSLKASDLPTSLAGLRSSLERDIPSGFNSHEEANRHVRDQLLSVDLKLHWRGFKDLNTDVQDIEGRAQKQMGTLGGGNHFIELCLDSGVCDTCRGRGADRHCPAEGCQSGKTEPFVWMMLHSGSRNIGKSLAEIHISKARKLIHNQKLPDKDLAVFLSGTEEMKEYQRDLFWAQQYAMLNRRVMFDIYKQIMRDAFHQITFGEPILCHHNYVSEETHFGESMMVTRKGAISAQMGQLGIIPGSMGTKSYIVQGLGNPESLNSASHGAGRRLSRSKAKSAFTEADLIAQTMGVECRKDIGVLDEIPGAYKDIDQVMRNQRDLVEVVAELKQVLCVKGN